jgi:hypothetical protein
MTEMRWRLSRKQQSKFLGLRSSGITQGGLRLRGDHPALCHPILTTKDTKDHKGQFAWGPPSCSFVSFVVSCPRPYMGFLGAL